MHGNSQSQQYIETQTGDSENLTQEFYTCDDYSVWGHLKDSHGMIINLRKPRNYFGRTRYVTNEPDVESLTFDPEKIRRSTFERLSQTHIIIERIMTYNESSDYQPAVVMCKGRNGLLVGPAHMEAGDKRILKNGDSISLPHGAKLYEFTYTKSAEETIESSCMIHQSFYIGEVIGRGACGEVHKVINVQPVKNSNGQEIFETYAIKCINKPKENLSSNEEEAYEALLNEVKIMRGLDHIHVLRLFKKYESIDHVILMFPYMRGGDLLSKILKQPMKRLSETDAKYFFKQLILGLEYLHSKGVTHRDIKPENILLSDRSDTPILSISDFGLSKMDDTMKTQCGTQLYVAPEILKKRANYTNAVDIWSAGVLLYAMLTGRMPFSNSDQCALRESILGGRYQFQPAIIWEKMATAKIVITFMLQVNPRNRLTAKLLINHSWLKDEQVNIRLQRAYQMNDISSSSFADEQTDDLEKTLINVSIKDDENPSKRQKKN